MQSRLCLDMALLLPHFSLGNELSPTLWVFPPHLHSTGALSITSGSVHHLIHPNLPAPSTTHPLGHTHYKEVCLEKPPAALSYFPLRVRPYMDTDQHSKHHCLLACVNEHSRSNFSNKLKGLTLLQCRVNTQRA